MRLSRWVLVILVGGTFALSAFTMGCGEKKREKTVIIKEHDRPRDRTVIVEEKKKHHGKKEVIIEEKR